MPFYLTSWVNVISGVDGLPHPVPNGTQGISGWGVVDLKPWRDRCFVGSVTPLPTGGGVRKVADTADEQIPNGVINAINSELGITITSRRLGDVIYEVMVAKGAQIEPERDGWKRVYLGGILVKSIPPGG